jgi:hypothetical protein
MRNQALRLWFVFGARLRLALAVAVFLFSSLSEQAYEFRGVCFRISRNALAVCCLLSFAMLACVIL